MEDIIGFLILLVTLIISVVASAKKQRGQNKTGEQPFENISDESTGEGWDSESSLKQKTGEPMRPWDEITDYEESHKDEAEEEEKEQAEVIQGEKEPEETKQKKGSESKVKTQDAETSPLKETWKEKKHKRGIPGKKSKIQEIKEKFDIEEGIIYSEIINKKYF